MIVLGIDPGSTTGLAVYDSTEREVRRGWEWDRGDVCDWLHFNPHEVGPIDGVGIECPQSYGAVVGFDVIQTAVLAGEIKSTIESEYGVPVTLIYRTTVRTHLTGLSRGSAADLKRATINHLGGTEKLIGGTKCPKCKGRGWFGAGRPPCPRCEAGELPEDEVSWEIPPGPCHDWTGYHRWDALAVAIAVAEGARSAALEEA